MSAPAEKCTFMLLHDDGRSISRRATLRSVRLLCAAIALLPPLLGAACWFAWKLHKENDALEAVGLQLEQENSRLSAELNRLSNLEQLLEMPDNAEQLALRTQQARNRAAEQPQPVAPPSETPAAQEQKDASKPEPGSSDGPPLSSPSVDMKVIGVENVHARLLPGDKVRIALDLHNNQQKSQLTGHVACIGKTAQGDIYPLEISKEISSFRINRFKRAVFAPRLPASARASTSTVIVEIHIEDRGVVYRNEFPIER